ncbi:nuclear respiratory factor 1 [Elysia marginata]|uniref:Nuclear respiratory factor 1 n=1 Tax=Elysia marginata TaxID=1093978 RepID=A0AAV4IL83_9GAST|nr:nuclear respiratory factor 1 [Elysia marginata]
MLIKRGNKEALPVPFQHWFCQEPPPRFVYVYVCYFCGEEFTSRETLQSHHPDCNMIPPSGGSQLTLQGNDLPETAQCQAPTSDQISSQCLQNPDTNSVWTKKSLGSDLHSCTSPKKTQLKQSLTPLKTPGRPSSPFLANKVSKNKYLTGLGLVPIQKAQRVSERRRSTLCENIDLDDDTLPSPSKPRTPKLLLSHLSRDESSSTVEQGKSCIRSLFSSQESRIFEEVEEVCVEKEANEEKGPKTDSTGKSQDRLRNAKSLFNIAISSPLGQFVMKHYKGDPSLHILSDVESHCLTEVNKNQEQGTRLRVRHPTYPITFRGYLRAKDMYSFHMYNFNKEHKKEFLRRVRTGLNRGSRALCKKLKKCKVQLTRLSKTEIELWMPSQNHLTVDLKHLTPLEIIFWTSPKPANVPSQPAVFPSGLSLTSPNLNKVLGLRTVDDKTINHRPLHRHLSVANFVSEEVAAEVAMNRRTVLNSIIVDLTAKGEISRDIMPINNPKLSSGIGNFATLRRLLSGSGDSGKGKLCTLPDITNLSHAARCKNPKVGQDHLMPSDKKLTEKSTREDNREAFKMNTKSMKLFETSKSSSSSQGCVVKSTTVRLAEEGAQIVEIENKLNHYNSSTITSSEKVFPVDLPSNSATASSPPNLFTPNPDRRCNQVSSSASRTFRKRPSRTSLPEQKHLLNLSKATPPSSVRTADSKKVIKENNILVKKNLLCKESAVAKSSACAAGDVNGNVSGVESVPVGHTVGFPKQNRAMYDVKFKKRLLSAGLVWRTHPSVSQPDQENKSNGTNVINLRRSKTKPRNRHSTKVSSSCQKKGRSTTNRAGSKRSGLVQNRDTCRTISKSKHGTLPNYHKTAGNSTQGHRSKNSNGLSIAKQCFVSQNEHLHNVRDKHGRFTSVNRGRNKDCIGSKGFFTTIKTK